MAKKKKQTRNRKKAAPEVVERSPFWPLAAAIILLVAAIFMLFGGFGTGGPLPKGLFNGTYWTFGWAAYITPIVLVFFGITKFRSEDKRVPLGKFISMLAALAFTSSWFHVVFANKQFDGSFTGGHGGEVGRLIGSSVLSAIDKLPAALMFFVFALLAYFYAFSVSPQVLMKIAEFFKKKPGSEDTDLASLKQKAGEHGFQLNEGVPVEHGAVPRLNSF
ncbi:MAG: DNA translocase FtsK 4TM domain-containing protein, partial [Candidatus Saccharimonadales bacterium]